MLLPLALLIPAVLILASVLVIFTEHGTRSALLQVERLLPLEIDYGDGSLSGRLYLQRLRYDTDNLRVELQGVALELAPGCLWRGALCFRQLRVEDLDITLLSNAGSDQESQSVDHQETAGQLIVFPLPMAAQSLDIASLRVRWAGGEWRQGALRASVRLQQSRLEVLGAQILEPKLTLQTTDSVEVRVPDSTILSAIDLPLILFVDDVQLIKPAWDFYGALFQQDEIAVRGQWQNSELLLDKLEVRSSDLGALSLNGKLVFEGNWPLEATAVIDLAKRLQYPDVFGGTVNVLAEGDLSALALQLNCKGAVDLAGEAELNVLAPAMPFSASVAVTSTANLALADIEGIPAVLQDVDVEFPLEISASGSLQTQHFELLGTVSGLGYESLRISALGKHEQEQVTITDLSVQDVEGTSELHASGEVDLSPVHAWSLATESTGFNVPAISETVRGRIDGSVQLAGIVQGERWQVRVVDVALQGQINTMPASIHGFTGLDSDLRLSSSALQAQLNGAQLSVQSPGDEVGPGHLHLRVEDIGRWQVGSSGLLEVDAEVSSDREHVQLAGRLQSAQWSGLKVGQATFTGDYQAESGHAFRLDTTLSDLTAGGMSFAELQLSAYGDAQKQSIGLASRGDIEGELNVVGTLQGEEWQGTLAPTRLQTPVGEWGLADAVAMRASRAEEQFTLDGHCWQHQNAQLCPGRLVLGAHGSGSIQVDGDLEIFAGILPPDLDMTGDLQLQLDALWEPGATISVNGKAKTSAVMFTQHLQEGEIATFGWDEADVGLRYMSEGLQLDVGVRRDNRRVVGLKLLLPPEREEAIVGSVTVDRLRMAGLTPFVPALATLAGELSGDISLSGTIDKPQGFGELTLAGGHVAIEGNPTQLQNLQLNLNVQGTGARIVGTGVLGGGDLDIFGRVDMDPDLRLELNVQGRDHTILYPPTTQLLVSQTLKLTLKKDLLQLTGELTVLDGLLEVEQLPEGSVALSTSVVEVNSDGASVNEELPFKLRMNVQIHIEDRFKVSANMLQTTLGGELRAQQRPGQPLQLFGNLNTIGGEFRAYQTRLQIKRGTINFAGPPANPTLNVRAERRITSGDVTVGVHVQGPLEGDLLLDIYSEPSMSQAEAMSYLVRGRGMDAGSGFDGTSAAVSLASGVVNSSELVTELNRIPGISNIEFGAEETETDTTATVSGYLGERIYLSYGVGLYEPVNVFTSRFYLRSRLWLEVVSSIENSVDLYYSFDID